MVMQLLVLAGGGLAFICGLASFFIGAAMSRPTRYEREISNTFMAMGTTSMVAGALVFGGMFELFL